MTDASAGQAAADAWTQALAPAAAADQKAVAAAADQASHAQDAADHTGGDALAAAAKTQKNHDAAAAQTHDGKVASTVHDAIVKRSQDIDKAVQAGAVQANKDVQAAVQNLAADITLAADGQVANAMAKNADLTAKSIALTDVARDRLYAKVKDRSYQSDDAAYQQRDDDAARSLNDPVVTRVNPPSPQVWYQVLNDYIPYASWGTIATTAGLVVGGTALMLIPGAGPVLLVAGLGLLGASAAYSASDRYFNQNQPLVESIVGGFGSATGVGALVTGFTGRDIGTGRHLGLTVEQERQMILPGAIQTASTLLLAYSAGKVGLASFAGECAAGSSNCFTAETMLWTAHGPVLITELLQGRRVLSRSQHDPDGPLTERLITAVYQRTAPIWEVALGGQVIRTTAEHPFWARGKGRVETADLQVGDELAGKDGEWTAVERVTATDRVEKVYNITIEEDHTYFVGGDAWGFAVWAHNYGDTPMGPTGPSLPEFDGESTVGRLITNEGQVVPLESGSPDPLYANYQAAGHVEGKAAIWMRQNGSTGGVVYHNNPNGTCGFCNAQIPTLLPEGATLSVVPPAGTIPPPRWFNNLNPYIGNSAIPKPNLRLGGI